MRPHCTERRGGGRRTATAILMNWYTFNCRRYERVAPRHSWDGAFLFTNGASFKLARHADHHSTARKPYQAGRKQLRMVSCLLHDRRANMLLAC